MAGPGGAVRWVRAHRWLQTAGRAWRGLAWRGVRVGSVGRSGSGRSTYSRDNTFKWLRIASGWAGAGWAVPQGCWAGIAGNSMGRANCSLRENLLSTLYRRGATRLVLFRQTASFCFQYTVKKIVPLYQKYCEMKIIYKTVL